MTESRFYIRYARSQDREAVLRFSEHTWEWCDYIPQVWDLWLAERDGKLLVATLRGEPVALCHVVMAAKHEAWLEGLRVHPEYRRAGLATRMMQRCMREAVDLRANVVRFTTSSLNTPVHRMADSLGFNRVATYLPLEAEATSESAVELLRPKSEELPRLLSFVRRSAALSGADGLYSTGWRFHQLNAGELRKRLSQGLVRAVVGAEGIGALAIIEPGYLGQGLAVSYADGQPDALIKLALGLRAEASSLDSQITARLPDIPELQTPFRQAGYQPASDHAFWVFQRVLDRSISR